MEDAISIFGLGYVGSVAAGCLSARISVVGVDVYPAKVEAMNAGRSTIHEPGLDALLASGVESGRIRATAGGKSAVAESQISLVCVGTPGKPNGELDLAYVEAVAAEIAEGIRGKGTHHHVVFRSTMLPGSTKKLRDAHFGELIADGLASV